MAEVSLRSVVCGGKTIEYVFERKDVKNVNLHMRSDGTVCVSASKGVDPSVADELVRKNSVRIFKAWERIKAKEESPAKPHRFADGEVFRILGRDVVLRVRRAETDSVAIIGDTLELSLADTEDMEKRSRLVRSFFEDFIKRTFSASIERCFPEFEKMGYSYPILKIRDMKSRWGSCKASANQITLNINLICFSEDCIDFVVMHELCHFIYGDHSRGFYEVLTLNMHEWIMRKRELDADSDRRLFPRDDK